MTAGRVLIVAILAATTLVVHIASHPLLCKDQTRRWRKWYDRLYHTAPMRGGPAVEVRVERVVEAVNKLFAMAGLDKATQLRRVPQSELDEISFWSTASHFTPDDCNIRREFVFLNHYAKGLATDQPLERPYLKAYVKHLKHKLVRYCIVEQNALIPTGISTGESTAMDRQMINSMGTIEDPVQVDYHRLKKFLLSVHKEHDTRAESGETSMMRTMRWYQSAILPACLRIKSLPEPTRDAILFLEHNKVLDLVTIKARQWLRQVRICELIATNIRKLNQVMKETIIGDRPGRYSSGSSGRSPTWATIAPDAA